jgi:hypothetical protein
VALPTLREALVAYCAAKRLKASSQKRYDSLKQDSSDAQTSYILWKKLSSLKANWQ